MPALGNTKTAIRFVYRKTTAGEAVIEHAFRERGEHPFVLPLFSATAGSTEIYVAGAKIVLLYYVSHLEMANCCCR